MPAPRSSFPPPSLTRPPKNNLGHRRIRRPNAVVISARFGRSAPAGVAPAVAIETYVTSALIG